MQGNVRGSFDDSSRQRECSAMEWETYDPEVEKREEQESRSTEIEIGRGWETYNPEDENPCEPEGAALKELADREAVSGEPVVAENVGEMERKSEEPEELSESEAMQVEVPMLSSEIGEQLVQLNKRLELLDRKFDQKISTSESQEIMAKTLYTEVQEYKKGMYSDILKPLLLEMVQLRNNIIRQCWGIMEKEGEEAMISVQKLLDYGEDIRDVLEAYDVEIFQAEPGSGFEPKNQKILMKVPMMQKEMDKKVAASLCDGYRYRNHTIMKENVKVYIYEPEKEDRRGLEKENSHGSENENNIL